MITRFYGKLKTKIERLLNVFFMHRCHICEEYCDFSTYFCKECDLKMQVAVHSPVKVYDVRCDCDLYVLSSYTTLVGDCIKAIKYRPSRNLLDYFITWLLKKNCLEDFFKADDILISVPMERRRLRRRGFNQAAEIAKAIAKKYGCNYSEPIKRLKKSKPQAECTVQERLTNLDNVMGIEPRVIKEKFKGRRIIIFDDVATTGTTVNKCAQALKAALEPTEIIGLVITHSYKISP